MVNEFEDYLDRIFHALADQTRRHILERLAERDLGIAEIAGTYDMSLVAVSKHVKVLERAGLVLTNKEGRVTRCMMRFEPLEPASQQIEFYKQFWRDQPTNRSTQSGIRQQRKKTSRRRK
jgi:DNA-binding transcriptional ArsR family regulator